MLLGVDLIIDCVDRISVRRTLSRFCLRKNIPLVHGGISFIGGQTAILTRETPCINCIYPDAEQEEDMKRETGCINQPDNSVVYTSQIIAGIMVNLVRRVLCPLSEKIDSKDKEFGLIKLHLEMNPPVYIARVKRRATCECIDILKKVAPNILLKEKQLREIEEKKKKEDENVALAALIGKK
jgi:molybdopterin/thiamine biosynthesis adenylyltransferase